MGVSTQDLREGRRPTVGLAILALAVAVVLASCHQGVGEDSVPSPLPSGLLGVVTQDAANRAVRGLCEMEGTFANDLHGANAVFYDQTHQELHVIAAAAELHDRPAAGGLLRAKEKVEADLRSPPVSAQTFSEDVRALLTATRDALHAIGLTTPVCGPPTAVSPSP